MRIFAATSFILLSLALHALVYRILRGIPLALPAPHPIAVELRETAKPPPAGSPRAHARVRTNRVRRGEDVVGRALRRLLPRSPFDPGPPPSASEIAARDADARGSSEWPNEQWGVRGGTFEELADFTKYEKLLREIQGIFTYPSVLGFRGIDGTVNVRLRFDEHSRCDWTGTSIKGPHPYLRFYVLAVLRKVCGLETLARIGFREKQFADISFAFVRALGEERAISEGRDSVTGNVLRFERVYHHLPFVEYRLGPFRGFWGVPFVNVDFEWIFYNWQKYVDGRDPLDEFRDR